jgi:hypothetical protein
MVLLTETVWRGVMMKLILHAEALWEQDWLRYLFGDLIDDVIVDLDLTCFADDSIHVVSGNWTPLPSCEKYFQECRARCKHIILVHVSDELFSGGYKMYQYFDLVIRWNHTYLADSVGILTIPLGVPSGTGQSAKPADQRKYAWSFIGHIKSSRIAMLAAFDGFKPQYLMRTDTLFNPNGKKVTKSEFDAVLAESVFSPCAMGNTTIDTCRVYESLDLGAIPLVELRLSLDYYTNLFGANPIPAFSSWTKARTFCERLYSDKKGLVQLQDEVLDWWQAYKLKVRAEVQAAVTGPSFSKELQQYGAMLRNRMSLIHEPLRIVELLRHQTSGSLLRRIGSPAVPLKRIIKESLSR